MIKFFKSFKYALRGILYTIINERNMRVHLVVATYVLIFASFFSLSPQSLGILVLTISAVIALEMVNTAIERVCNIYTTSYHPMIKVAKDVAAGAVLVAAIGAVAVGVIIFWQPNTIIGIFSYLWANPPALAALILSLALSVLFIIFGGKWFTPKK
ncbi:MAG TPA: diacylglycerol kinase family protein [Clostridiales bacterium]|nr:diacylglycerol kinase family protein [Clostridiales bacterium]